MASDRRSETDSRGIDDRGLDEYGRILREGAPERVDPAFRPVVDDLSRLVPDRFGDRLNGTYLYGSVPRGTARVGDSDLDAMVVVTERSDGDRPILDELEAGLDEAHEAVAGVGIVLGVRSELLDPSERYDGGFFTACLCTPLAGEDLAALLPDYRPSVELARGLNGNYAERLVAVRRRFADGADPRWACRFARKIVRTAFCLVLARWNGWTSDPDVVADVFADDYPERAADLRRVVALVRRPSTDPAVVSWLLDDFGVWLRDEYARRILAI